MTVITRRWSLLFFLFLALAGNSFAHDSARIRISLLTCSPGEELYATFGHSALRVTDSSSMADIVFNFGTFDFDDPNFYAKFIRGKLLYYLSTDYFIDFRYLYETTGRAMQEQVLDLTAEEKRAIRDALYENAKEANKYYHYDFLFDNCTTRLRDIILQHHRGPVTFRQVVPPGTTFRQAIHHCLDNNGKYWSKLGIDILLGLPTDAVMSVVQVQFLPENLMRSLDSSDHGKPLALSNTPVYQVKPVPHEDMLLTPMVTGWSLFLLVLCLTFINRPFIRALLNGTDGILFFLTGLLGILLLFMMTATDHSMCRNNFNLLWTMPTNIILAFCISSKKRWVKKAFAANTVFLCLVVLAWFFLPQQMNPALLPVTGWLITRSWRHATQA